MEQPNEATDQETQKILELMNIPLNIMSKSEWNDLEKHEWEIGPDNLIEEILSKRIWSNVEMVWVIRRMVYLYGKKDALLKKAPVERLMTNMVDVLRAFFLVMDKLDPDLDDNIRSYIGAKLTDAAWGINNKTREYLAKID